MVNTGKPSGGCKLCRARRIKCDEGKPFCMRCRKSRRQCPGYRDPFEANIRDETEATIKRFKKSRGEDDSEDEGKDIVPICNKQCLKTVAGPKYKTLDYSNPAAFPYHDDDDTTDEDKDIPASMFDSLDEQASCYFLSEFIIVPCTPAARGYYRFLPRFLSGPKVSKCLSQAYKAVSLAALASRRSVDAGAALFHAQGHYVRAVRAVNKAIMDPQEVLNDQTLGAVLMLAFYEMLTSSRDSITEYINHMKGAAIMVKLRGQNGLETPEGEEMFAITRNQCLSIHCLPNSPEVSEFTWLLHHECRGRMQHAIASMDIQSSQIRQDVDRLLGAGDRKPETTQKVLNALRRAQALEAKFRRLNNDPSPQWKVDTIELIPELSEEELDTAESFTGPVYGFFNLPLAILHVATWCCHLMLTTTILRCMAWLVSPNDYRLDEEYEELKRSAQLRIQDTIASTPYFCKWNGYGVVVAQFPVGTTRPDDPLKGAAGLMILCPLVTACSSDFATHQQRRFLRGRLKYLAEVAGIKQANVFYNMKDVLSPSREIERDRMQDASSPTYPF
ncbi:Putative zn(2)Cys(6) fungal-type DNA-binding domain, fungal transcription factor [Colletotrichum destructivum]|uniref:Zn(2)Cys(6) fungal-type DNA-binding domain, fungal transcription factor n=1 Tax=Colletotrichum destructivum TaxID=34406 RepID=A0AAX4IVT0_9PEZI|nr:Putative zn(2)Cys(6) fungal-type DNA-binding domain, fungal transcription factor [Colletotrichum destructivum]